MDAMAVDRVGATKGRRERRLRLRSINEPTAAVTACGLDKEGDGKRMRRFMRIGCCFNNGARYSQLRRKASLS